jgi:hypothetical protein
VLNPSEPDEFASSADAPIEVRTIAERLLDVLRRDVPKWIAKRVVEIGGPSWHADAALLGFAGWELVASDMEALLRTDIDLQRHTPLTILRRCSVQATSALQAAGVAYAVRDAFDLERFPQDLYGFGPVTFADVSEEAGNAGLRWSVAKAFEHKRRHRTS